MDEISWIRNTCWYVKYMDEISWIKHSKKYLCWLNIEDVWIISKNTKVYGS